MSETADDPSRNSRSADDRSNILPGEKAVLIIEDDRDFAQWLLDLAQDEGLQGHRRPRAGISALELVREIHAGRPFSSISVCRTSAAGRCSTA